MFRGTVESDYGARASISDDWGATWSEVNVGGVANGSYINGAFKYGVGLIWIVGNGGYIWYSEDRGDSWTAISGDLTRDRGRYEMEVGGRVRSVDDLWGNTVNIASRMESNGAPGQVNVSKQTQMAARDHFEWIDRGKVEVKGGGLQHMFFAKRPS